jgi:diacylglycerol O-acyltransferase
MKLMGPGDSVWLLLESRDAPMHFGTLMVFSPPARSGRDYVDQLVSRARRCQGVQPPWNHKLVQGPFGLSLPVIREDQKVDLDHHVRYHKLPRPGDRKALLDFVCQLQSQPLELSKPLWESHFIGGLEGNRFGLYTKIHHALLDGGSAVRLLMGMLSGSPKTRNLVPMWANVPSKPDSSGVSRPPPRERPSRFRASTKVLSNLLSGSLAVPYTEPNSILRKTLTAPRDIAIQEFGLTEVKAVAKAGGCTVNDLVLYLCGTALRRFLDDIGNLPDRSLNVGVPVNVRSADDVDSVGNATSQLYVNLATNVADPLARLEAIKKSVAAGKAQIEMLPGNVRSPYMLSVTAPYVLGMVAGLGGHAPVPYSVSLSNVPGPATPLYFNGAKLESFYPLSFLMHGGALLVLCTSYAGKLILTITGAREQLPEFHRIADDFGEAFEEISQILRPSRSTRPSRNDETSEGETST